MKLIFIFILSSNKNNPSTTTHKHTHELKFYLIEQILKRSQISRWHLIKHWLQIGSQMPTELCDRYEFLI